MAGKRAIVAALLGIAVLATSFGPPSAQAQTTERTTVARPDLALSARDLPPGFEEVSPEFMSIGGMPIEDRVLRRQGGGIGAYWYWSVTYQAPTTPTDESVNRASRNIAVILSRTFGENVHLSDWQDQDPAGLGDIASLRTFHYQNLNSGYEADGALVVLSRGDIVSVLAALSTDGRVTGDAHRYARLLDSRIQQDLLASAR